MSSVGYLLIARDRSPDLIKKRAEEIFSQELVPSTIIVCVDRPEFVPETTAFLEEFRKTHDFKYSIVQLCEKFENELLLVDECYRYHEGYLFVFRSDFKIPKDFCKDFHTNFNDKMIFFVQPFDDLSGMVIHTKAFEKLYGNKPVIHPDGTKDRRTYEERVEELFNANTE